ncbi:DUF2946 family protein [Variovorax sp. Sphag1AA]|uniref:DUF2946 family protein n=1 Tax=Variovorax sp. Sphag1AA TaxID=2587027 RepID=UPI00160F4B03|nr:DUF2946 family protein [Variovorax sp. Sphag1AA]MBB3181818.1 hypothetical protein [Variovorax sp. Sphag1AA]
MKSFRVWLLVLLVFALPMRGAMAAAMLGANGSGPGHATVVSVDLHDHGHHEGHGASHSHAAHEHASHHTHDAGDKCSVCAFCCSAGAPMAATLVLPQAPPATAELPSHSAQAAEFLSGRQERPPRSI